MSRHHRDELPSLDPTTLSDVSGGAGMSDMMLPMMMMGMRKRSAAPPPAAPPPPQQPQLPPLDPGAQRTVYYSDGTSRQG
jgi:hypothetical protein